jgi:hypothetical protein
VLSEADVEQYATTARMRLGPATIEFRGAWLMAGLMVCERPAMPTNRRPSPQDERVAREAPRLRAAELFVQGRNDVVNRKVCRRLERGWDKRPQHGPALRARG